MQVVLQTHRGKSSGVPPFQNFNKGPHFQFPFASESFIPSAIQRLKDTVQNEGEGKGGTFF